MCGQGQVSVAALACSAGAELWYPNNTTKYLRKESIILEKPFKPEDWISMTEAASLRGVSRAAIADLVKRGKLKSHEIGGRRLVNKAEVMAFRPLPIGRPRKKSVKEKPGKKV